MARIIAISQAKGGVGKTTTAVNLAFGLAQNKKRVLLLDTDTQGQVTRFLGVDPSKGLFEFIEEEADPRDVLAAARPNLWVMAGGKALAKLERTISRNDFRPEMTLTTAMTPLHPYFDYVLIDTAPSWGALAINVLAYAQELLTPCELEALGIDGLIQFLERVKPIFSVMGGRLAYVLPTKQDRRRTQTEHYLAQLREHFGDLLCDPIRLNVRLSESPAFGQAIFEYDPKSNGAADYQRLIQRVLADE